MSSHTRIYEMDELTDKATAGTSATQVLEKVKGRVVLGGHRQNPNHFEQHELSSPTATELAFGIVLGQALVNRRRVSVVDIKTAYLNATMKDPNGDMFCELSKELSAKVVRKYPKYSAYLTSKGKLLARVDKAVYGCK